MSARSGSELGAKPPPRPPEQPKPGRIAGWRCEYLNGNRSTLVGPGLETEADAREAIAHKYGPATAQSVKLTPIGEH